MTDSVLLAAICKEAPRHCARGHHSSTPLLITTVIAQSVSPQPRVLSFEEEEEGSMEASQSVTIISPASQFSQEDSDLVGNPILKLIIINNLIFFRANLVSQTGMLPRIS